jgi:hypothetical protein
VGEGLRDPGLSHKLTKLVMALDGIELKERRFTRCPSTKLNKSTNNAVLFVL